METAAPQMETAAPQTYNTAPQMETDAPKFVPLIHGHNSNWSRTCRHDGGGDGG
jgi:hypothetical protein